MATITRSTLKTGPAIVTHDSATYHFKDGLKLTEEIETFDVNVQTYGRVDARIKDRKVKISGTPAGEWENLTKLFPWVSASIGTRLHGDTDKALVITCLDGTIYTYHNAALSKMPSLKFAATETLLGPCEWTARVKDATAPTAAASLFTRSSGSFTDTSFASANIKTQLYTLTWGAAPWDDFNTVDGVEVSLDVKWKGLEVDGFGVLDDILEDLQIEAKFKPLGIARADIDTKLALQNSANAAIGSSLNARGASFIISGTGVYVLLRGAAATGYGEEFGMGKLRAGEMSAVATRTFNAGVAEALAYIGTAAP